MAIGVENMSLNTPEGRQDLYKAIIALVIIITCAVLVSGGKLDIGAFAVVLSGVSGYYFGKASSQGSILK